MLDLLQRLQPSSPGAVTTALIQLPKPIFMKAKLLLAAGKGAWGTSLAAAILWAMATCLLATAWAATSAAVTKLAVLVGLAAAVVQGISACGYSICMVMTAFTRVREQASRADSEDRAFNCAVISWICFIAAQLAVPVMPYVLIRPWLFGVFLGIAVGQSVGLRYAKFPARDLTETGVSPTNSISA